MKGEKIVFMLLLCFSFLCNAQSKIAHIKVEKNTTVNQTGSLLEHTTTYEFRNISNETVWLWFDKTDMSKLSDSTIIHRHFFESQGEVNLFQIGVDGNVDEFTPDVFFGFLKAIPSGKCFYVKIIHKQNATRVSLLEATTLLDSHIVSYKKNYILRYFPSLQYLGHIVFVQENYFVVNL